MTRLLLLLPFLALPVAAQAQGFPASQQFGVYNPRTRQYTLYYQISGPTYQPRQHHYAGWGRYPSNITPRLYVPITVPQQRQQWNYRR